MSRHRIFALTLSALSFAAHATPLTGEQVLQEFNLIVVGNANTASHTDGRAYIGGNLVGANAVFTMHPSTTPLSTYAGLTIGGNGSGFQVTDFGLTALGNVNNVIVNNGTVAVAGNANGGSFNGSGGSWVGGASSGVNTNSGTLGAAAAAALFDTAQSTDIGAALADASAAFGALTSTGSWWSVNGSKVSFHAVAGADGLAVFDLRAVDELLLSMNEFEFDMGTATAAVINADLAVANIHANFLGSGAQALASSLLWNFTDATSVTLNSQFGGSVLAANALLTNTNNIEGGVYVGSLAQYGEIHQGGFTGRIPRNQVPEPTSAALVLLALAAAAGARRRSGAKA